LREARREAGLGQRELARRAGMPQPTVSRIERGIASPRFDTLDRLLLECGRQLDLAERSGLGVDRSLIRERLMLTPGERARAAVREWERTAVFRRRGGGGGRGDSVIARVWFGRTKAEDYDAYLAYLEESGVGELRATAGNRGVMVLRRKEGDEAEFGVVSFWDSLEDVKAFAGEDVDVARYFPDDERFLLEFTPKLKHYEVAFER
jgi:transcriptional regulator with XRE-family HTH domain